MDASPLFWIIYPLLALLSVEVGWAQRRGESICQSMQYRTLSMKLQNEHQCIVLEKLQKDFDNDRTELKHQYQNLNSMLLKLQSMMNRNIKSKVSLTTINAKSIPNLRDIPLVRDCHELYLNGITKSGVYAISLPNQNTVNVWCDMTTGGGGWTLIQRRVDGSVNFTRNWEDYAFGFGNPNTEYWLGNDNLHHLSDFKNFSIRFDLWDWEGNRAYALYNYFKVENEKTKYRLTVDGYSGTAGDAMSKYHNKMRFSTIDNDNDQWFSNCAHKDLSGWWYNACGYASLNGLYTYNSTADMSPDGLIKGIIWYNWKKNYGYSMKQTEIKIKPLAAIKFEREVAAAKEDEKAQQNAAAEQDKDDTDSDLEATTVAGVSGITDGEEGSGEAEGAVEGGDMMQADGVTENDYSDFESY